MASWVEWTHRGSYGEVGGVGAGGGTSGRGFSSSLSIFEELSERVLRRREEEDGTTTKLGSQDEEGTYDEWGS